MSRTHKDRPLWVRNNDPREDRIAQHFHRRTYSPPSMRACEDGCTINTSVSLPRHAWKTDDSPCGYVVNISRNYHNTPDRKTRRTMYHRPIRSDAKRYAREAMNAYNHQDDWQDEGIAARTNPDIKQWWNW